MAKDSWLTVNPMSGKGNATLGNSGTLHTGRLTRSTTVTASVIGLNAGKSYAVNQEPSLESIVFDKTSFNVSEDASTVTITGKSNSPKITFSLDTGNNIPITLPTTYTANEVETSNGSAIAGDPGAKAEFSFSIAISIPKNTVGQRVGKILAVGSDVEIKAQATITQATSSYTVSYVKGDYIDTINKTSEKVNYGGTATATATLPANTVQYAYTFDGWYDGSTKVGSDLALSVAGIISNRTFTAIGNRTLNRYTLVITVTPTGAGTTVGQGTYNYGSSVQATATPATGYNFTKWVLDTGDERTANPLTGININGNRTVQAVFTPKTYSISANAAYRVNESGDFTTGTTGGTVYGGGTYTYGNSVSLKATPATGYSLVGWFDSSDTSVGTSSTYTITSLTANTTLTAKFQKNWYTVTYTRGTGVNSLSKTSERVAYNGTVTSETAVASTGYNSPTWTKSSGTGLLSVSAGKATLSAIQSNCTLVASATINKYTISYTKNANIASISKTSETVNYGGTATCTATLPENTAQYTYSFGGWYEGSTRVGTALALSVANITAARTFEARGVATVNKYTLTVVNGSGSGTYNYGTKVTITASTIEGKTFSKWSDGVTTASREVTVTANATYTAEYTTNTYTVTYAKSDYVASLSKTSERVAHGANATGCTMTVMSTTAQYSYAVDGWYSGATKKTSNATYAPTAVTADVTYTAKGTRTLRSYTVTYNKGSYISSVSRTSESVSYGSNAAGSTAKVMANTAQYSYAFDGWYNGSTRVSTALTYAPTNITGALTLEARATRTTRRYTATIGVDSSCTGRCQVGSGSTVWTSSFSETVNYGDKINLQCKLLNSGDVFAGWYENETLLSTNLTYPITVTSNRNIVAKVWFIDVSPTSLSYEASGGSKTVTVKSNIPSWSVS